MATVSAWPMCKLPVTLGGGQGMTKGSESSAALEYSGLKKPWADHQSYQDDSTAMGLYPAAIGWVRSRGNEHGPRQRDSTDPSSLPWVLC